MEDGGKEDRKGKDEERRNSRFFKQGNRWFFGVENEAEFGPFDRVYDIVMDDCFLGRWRGEQRELTGGEIARLLQSGVQA